MKVKTVQPEAVRLMLTDAEQDEFEAVLRKLGCTIRGAIYYQSIEGKALIIHTSAEAFIAESNNIVYAKSNRITSAEKIKDIFGLVITTKFTFYRENTFRPQVYREYKASNQTYKYTIHGDHYIHVIIIKS